MYYVKENTTAISLTNVSSCIKNLLFHKSRLQAKPTRIIILPNKNEKKTDSLKLAIAKYG